VPLRDWPNLLRRTVTRAARDRVTMFGASLAFHAFLALLPILIAAVGLLGLVGLSTAALHSLVHTTSVLLPAQMAAILNHQLIKPPSRQVNLAEVVLGLLVALWSSVEATAALQIALDVAYEMRRDRGFIGRRLMAVPLIVLTLVLGGVASVLLVLGDPLRHLLPSGLSVLITVLRYAGSLLLVVLLLSAYYNFGPARERVEWEWISPGSVVATLGWIGVALLYSFYLDHFGHESQTYGALAGVAVTLLWMFLTAVLILFGAELNRELERATESR
jgi:membrane protein